MNRQAPRTMLGLVALGLATILPAGAVLAQDLVLYTSQPQTDAQMTVDAFRKVHPEIGLTFVRDGTPKIMAKLRAEQAAGAPQADLLLIADAVTMESLKRDDLLLPLPALNTGNVPAETFDPGKSWFGTKLITTGIIYNKAAPFVPASWDDLLRPEAKGLIAMPSPLASGAALIHTVTLTGSLPEGWSYYQKLAANGALAEGANGGVLKSVAGGEKLFGMIVDYMPIREKAKGAPVEFVFPKEGVSAVTEPVAVLRSSKNPKAAEAFVAFLLSPTGQELAAQQGYVPADPKVALPPGYPARDAIKLLPFDAARALAEEDANRQRFQAIFGQ
jgi:iron(III) transport system substrate-binding protein